MTALRIEPAGEGRAVRAHLTADRRVTIRYEIITPRGRLLPDSVTVEGAVVVATSPAGITRDELRLAGDGALEITRSWSLHGPSRVRLACTVDLEGGFTRWVVPSVMYDGNTEGAGRYPRGGLETGWSFREDRCPIPSCAICAGDSGSWAFFSSPAGSEREIGSIRSRTRGNGVELEIATPFDESPHSYREKGWPVGGQHGPRGQWFDASAGISFTRTFMLLPAAGSRIPYIPLFTAARERCMPPGRDLWAQVDWERYIALKVHWLRRHALYRRGNVVGALRAPRMPAALQRYFGDYIGGSFLSKGMEAALSFRRLGLESGDEELSAEAREMAGFLLRGELPSGLAFDDYSIHARRFGGFFFPGRGLSRVASTRCMGESAQGYARLFEAFGDRADARWLAHARRIADFFVEHQLPDGNFGRFWSTAGELRDARGTNGAYIIWLMAELARLGSVEYLPAARRAAGYFIGTAVRPQRFTFDTLDAECVDKEAGHALLRAFLLLHRLTGEPVLAEAAREAASFCLGWQFTWDVPFSPGSPLGALGFSTFGGTTVSVAHHHLDPYGMMIALDFLRLSAAVSEPRWETWAHDLMGFCGQLVSTPERALNLGEDFLGYQPEQYNHTDWDYMHHRLGGKGAYGSAATWVASSTLGAALDIRAEFPAQLPGTRRIDLSALTRRPGAAGRLP
jgi:hypothetical protein